MINLNNYSRKPLYKDIPLLEMNNDGSKSWYLNGVELTEKEFKERHTNDSLK